MSDPGLMPNTSQMTPELLQQMQQYQDYMKKQQMASLLAQPTNATGAFGGIANAGASIANAIAGKNARDKMLGNGFMSPTSNAAQAPSAAPAIQTQVTGQKSWNPQTGQLYSLGASS